MATPPFPLESMAILQSVASNGIVNDWPLLRKLLVRRLEFLTVVIPTASEDSPGDLSPTSTIVLTDDSSPSRSLNPLIRTRAMLCKWIESIPSAPISIQRVCEILSKNEPNHRTLFFSIERCLSSCHRDELLVSSLNRKATRCSTSSSFGDVSSPNTPSPSRQRRYSDTMITRTLKRSRGVID
jgi:hypothetical protein